MYDTSNYTKAYLREKVPREVDLPSIHPSYSDSVLDTPYVDLAVEEAIENGTDSWTLLGC